MGDKQRYVKHSLLKWDRLLDEIYTKRQVASQAAEVFDPIGLITPFTVRSKMLLQNLWMQDIDWDEDIPTECCRKWTQWLSLKN